VLALLAAVPTAVATPLLAVAGFFAQVTATPDSTLPGGATIQKVLNWTSYLALAGCLGSLLVGSMVWGLAAHSGNGYQAGQGRKYAIAGAIGAVIAGLAPTIVNTLFAG
jgi:hypothetical protein